MKRKVNSESDFNENSMEKDKIKFILKSLRPYSNFYLLKENLTEMKMEFYRKLISLVW